MHLHEAFAHALHKHEVDTMFGLMGDGNLFMVESFTRGPQARYVAAVHEASALLMAQGYASVSGRLGVATVTHGPALTNLTTALVETSLARLPLLVIAGDTAAGEEFNVQNIPQRDFVLPTGAGFEAVTSAQSALRLLAKAIGRAHRERRPIVLNVPIDLWWQEVDDDFVPSTWTGRQATAPDPLVLDRAVGLIATAKKPIVLVGRGASSEATTKSVVGFADRIGAVLATTLKSKDLLRDHPFNLGIFGTLSTAEASPLIADSDCIISFGASLNPRTTAEQSLLAGKRVVQVDVDPRAFGALDHVDVTIEGDAATVADTLVAWLDEAATTPSTFRSPRVESLLAARESENFTDRSTDDSVDIRTAMRWVNSTVTADRTFVCDAGRFTYSAVTLLDAPSPDAFVDTINFGSIGLGMGNAIGAFFGAPDRTVLLASGDGGFMMGGLTEFNTAVRNQVDLIVVIFNDGSYGAEHIQFTRRGMDPRTTLFDWPDFAPVAVALGAEGVTVRNVGDFERAAQQIRDRKGPILVDIKMDPGLVSLPLD